MIDGTLDSEGWERLAQTVREVATTVETRFPPMAVSMTAHANLLQSLRAARDLLHCWAALAHTNECDQRACKFGLK